jgi:ABC-type nitrate/sulfonate/bicarbonate transport system permease component
MDRSLKILEYTNCIPQVILPPAVPYILTGKRVALGFSFMEIVAAAEQWRWRRVGLPDHEPAVAFAD